MYRLHARNHVVSVSPNVCRLQDQEHSLELTAAPGQLSLLIHRLHTGFTRRSLAELLCEQVHPRWRREHMWEELGAWLILEHQEPASYSDAAIPENGLTGELAHLRSENAKTRHARAQQVVHVNTMLEPMQTLVLALARDGWRTFISHDPAKISRADTSLNFSAAHIGADRTQVFAQQARKISPWVTLVDAQALAATTLNNQHQALWLLSSVDELTTLGPHVAAELDTLPILIGQEAWTVGPWLRPDQGCFSCLAETLETLTGKQRKTHSLSATELALLTLAVHEYVAKRALQWIEQKDPTVRPASRSHPDSLLMAGASSTGLSELRISELVPACQH